MTCLEELVGASSGRRTFQHGSIDLEPRRIRPVAWRTQRAETLEVWRRGENPEPKSSGQTSHQAIEIAQPELKLLEPAQMSEDDEAVRLTLRQIGAQTLLLRVQSPVNVGEPFLETSVRVANAKFAEFLSLL